MKTTLTSRFSALSAIGVLFIVTNAVGFYWLLISAYGPAGAPYIRWLFRHPAILHDQVFDRYYVSAFGRVHLGLAAMLVVGSHVFPYSLRKRRVASRVRVRFWDAPSYRDRAPSEPVVLNGAALAAAANARLNVVWAWAAGLSLGIVLIGWSALFRSAISIRGGCLSWGNPAEYTMYLAVAVICFASHVPRLHHERRLA